jgi:hypothetical protein
VGAICLSPVPREGRNPLYSPFELRIFSLALRARPNISVGSVVYRSRLGLTNCNGGSTSQSECLSLNKGPFPSLASPGETLGERIDLIVVAAGK